MKSIRNWNSIKQNRADSKARNEAFVKTMVKLLVTEAKKKIYGIA